MGKARYVPIHPAFSETLTEASTKKLLLSAAAVPAAEDPVQLERWPIHQPIILDVMKMCVYHLQIRFLIRFLWHWHWNKGAPIPKMSLKEGMMSFWQPCFFPQWNVLVRNIRCSETVIENMNENITQ